TPANPSAPSAPWMARPCGSRTPSFSVTKMRAFMPPRLPGSRRCGLLDEHRAALRARLVLVQDAEPPRPVLVGLKHSPHVAAEAVLVQLVVGHDVPETAGIGGDLVGDDDPHHVVLPQPSAFHLEVDETDADTEEEAGEEVVHADRERHDVVD